MGAEIRQETDLAETREDHQAEACTSAEDERWDCVRPLRETGLSRLAAFFRREGVD